jgi:hypothetical protein
LLVSDFFAGRSRPPFAATIRRFGGGGELVSCSDLGGELVSCSDLGGELVSCSDLGGELVSCSDLASRV